MSVFEGAADTVSHGDIFGGIAVVVALKRSNGKSVGADNGNLFIGVLINGQAGILVFKKNGALLSNLKIERTVLLTVKPVKSDIAVGAYLFEFSEKEADCEDSFCRSGNILIGYKVLLIGFNKGGIGLTAVEVAGALKSNGSGFFGGFPVIAPQSETT